ncbi:hypothetical protein L228DRAFT_142786 [Xylona heveae TC161]|uniref:Uncharacterized protein n=1 Tax=Xylona heveae (strain CBS 132557 / TC161) TaxID=1328760 RepID=A0A165H738_XYLHT|nr:hypothetical protein L228DRAFT_142786 [Xylona heveae TC161]KZF23076.1 hypothetical protein L228DRAFT_142786 [Xylona heveae TC161]
MSAYLIMITSLPVSQFPDLDVSESSTVLSLFDVRDSHRNSAQFPFLVSFFQIESNLSIFFIIFFIIFSSFLSSFFLSFFRLLSLPQKRRKKKEKFVPLELFPHYIHYFHPVQPSDTLVPSPRSPFPHILNPQGKWGN